MRRSRGQGWWRGAPELVSSTAYRVSFTPALTRSQVAPLPFPLRDQGHVFEAATAVVGGGDGLVDLGERGRRGR